MYAALAVVLAALAVFSVLASWSSRPAASRTAADDDQLRGFIYVGAGALLILAVAVMLVGWMASSARAEGLAMFGFFTYVIYLLAAFVIDRVTTRH